MAVKLENVRVEYSNKMTVNIGNFQNLQPGFTISADVPEGENPIEAAHKLRQTVDSLLEAEVKRIVSEL